MNHRNNKAFNLFEGRLNKKNKQSLICNLQIISFSLKGKTQLMGSKNRLLE